MMRIFKKISAIQKFVALLKRQGKTIGFVPTMGSLHEGHLSLVRRAKKECDAVCVSIFVNPLQFGQKEDFKKYPRGEKRDLKLLKNCGVELVFLPSGDEMYAQDYRTHLEVAGKLTEVLEGAFRPGHFRGVTTVVAKLFHAAMPDRAYFGMKDYQQFKIIQKMTRDMNMDVRIVPCGIVRERDGLALSSRNAYLMPEERERAGRISRTLLETKKSVVQGEKNVKRLKRRAFKMLSSFADKIDYFELCDAETLMPLEKIKGNAVVLTAVRIGKTRLIDNVVVNGV